MHKAGKRKKMRIKDILPSLEPISLLLIGAMDIGEQEGVVQRLEGYDIRVIGFEPNQVEYQKLVDNNQDSRICYFPFAIGDGESHLFHLTNTGMTSSLFPPNMSLLNQYQCLGELCQVVDVNIMETKRLDDISELADIDYIGIDVQGAELMALSNAENLLKNVGIIQTEVEFVELYKKQPLFAEVDQECRRQGFQFHKFMGISGRTLKPLIAGNNLCERCSQMLWADAVYIKDLLNLATVESGKLLKMAVVLHEVYASTDVCHYILAHYDQRHGTALALAYRSKILGIK